MKHLLFVLALLSLSSHGQVLTLADPALNASASQASQGPDSVSGLVLWYKPESLSGANGTAIATWTDSSANGWDMTNAVSGKQPYITNSVANGYAAAYFDGGDVLFAEGGALSSWRNVAGATLIAVVRTNSVSSLQGIAFAGRNVAGSARAYLFSNSGKPAVGGRRLDSDSFASSMAGDLLPGGWTLVEAWIDYSNSDAATYTNGVLAGSTTSFQTDGNTSDTDSAAVCLGGISASPGEPFIGWIAEVMMFNRAISSADRSIISSYFVQKYAP